MSGILIIACGNPLRGDDGVAWCVARQLASKVHSSGIEILLQFELTPDLAKEISGAECVIFVDAESNGTPGEVRCRNIQAATNACLFSHRLTPALLLAYARDLYHAIPNAVLVSVVGQTFEMAERLSAPVEESVPIAVHKIIELAANATPSLISR